MRPRNDVQNSRADVQRKHGPQIYLLGKIYQAENLKGWLLNPTEIQSDVMKYRTSLECQQKKQRDRISENV